ncbi:MAG: polyisoprenoid-binding protein [Sandarakinorhabdus sp.]|nr:polyisoprenoid-binding protein [Sandarakinorhabdus sp.]MBS3962630.1 polyisoprenoid-binding protein [Sandarakinorhabdus sp.]
MSAFRNLVVAASLIAGAPALALAAPLNVPAGVYELDKTHASLTWQIRHLGLSNYTARFASYDATINLDPADPTRSSVSVTIDPRSVRTDFPFPEKENFDAVIAERFLRAGAHPTITFRSTGLKATGATTGKLTGDLTLMGITRPVTLDVTLNGAIEHPFRKIPALGFSATGTFKRSDFGSKELQGPIGDEIRLIIEAEFLKK